MNIRDIAEMAGVSPSTVSRALNHPNKVKPETLDRIRTVIREQNYRTNPFASNIIHKKTKNIVMIVPSLDISYLSDLSGRVAEHVNRKGFMLNLMSTSRDMDYQKSIFDFLAEKAGQLFMDGLIIAGSTSAEKESLQLLQESISVPVVIIEYASTTKKLDTVYIDEVSGIDMAMNYIKSQGYSRLGVFTSLNKYSFTKRRLKWISTCAKKHGLIIQERDIVEGDTASLERSLEAAVHFFNQESLPDAVYAFNDTTARALLRRAYEQGIRIPEDMGLFCGEYSSACDATIPTLTSIVRPLDEIARIAVELLLSRIINPHRAVEHMVLPVSLSIKESC